MPASLISQVSTYGPRVLDAVFSSAPIWVPLLFIFVWWDLWLRYKRRHFIKEQGSVLLEVKVPRELPKSPQAIEIFLTSLYNVFAGHLIKVYWEGAVRPWFSLEIVSIGGSVHFFIWGPKNYKSRIETQLYAQFSNIEVHEVSDYALGVHHDPERLTFGWMGQLTLTKADAYPIKTYIDYGLNEDPDEEYKHDPLVPLLEYMGSLKSGEQAWVQILIQGHAKEGLRLGRLFPKPNWESGITKEIKEYIKKNAPQKEEAAREATVRDLTKTQMEVITAIERNKGKTPFDTMIRTGYFATKEAFNPVNIGGLLGNIIGHFSSPTSNGFRPAFSIASNLEYPWQNFKGKEKERREKLLLEAYKRRSFFNPPFKNFHGRAFVLTTEELATLWHFPSSQVATTPTLSRIPSKKAEAPSNLPV